MDNSILLFLLGQVITGAAIWGAIRADIRNMHLRMDDIKRAADTAHARMDRHLEQNVMHSMNGNGQ